MKRNSDFLKEVKGIYRAKLQRRKKLTHLPFPKKVDILLQLQRMAAVIKSKKPVWSL